MKFLPRFVYCHGTTFYNTTSELPLTNYPLSCLLTGILYILVKNYIAIGTLSKMIKIYEAYLQAHRSWRVKEIGTLKTFWSIPTLITDHELYFDCDDYYAMKPSISFYSSVIQYTSLLQFIITFSILVYKFYPSPGTIVPQLGCWRACDHIVFYH